MDIFDNFITNNKEITHTIQEQNFCFIVLLELDRNN